MEDIETVEAGPRTSITHGRRVAIAATVGIVSVAWFMFLSGWLGVTPGTILAVRHNVLFDSDASLWVDRMIGTSRSLEQTIHPLELLLWRGPCRALAHVAGLFASPEYARLFGPRMLVALLSGAGVGFMAYLALYLEIAPVSSALLLVSYLLFTNNTTISLPEHFGVTNGLLTMAFVVLIVVSNERLRNGLLVVLAVLCGGTSVTHGLLPGFCLFDSVIKSAKLKLRLALAAIPLGLLFSVVMYHISGTVHWFFGSYTTYRFPYHPWQTFVYSVYMLVLPAVGGTPFLKIGTYEDHIGKYMVTYEPMPKPLDFSYYFGIQGVGAVLWLVLLAACIRFALRDSRTRQYVFVALAWILYNLVFYNVWGREVLLSAAAWSWTLMALVVLGARHLSTRFIAATVVPIAVCQVVTLHEIKNLLLMIKI